MWLKTYFQWYINSLSLQDLASAWKGKMLIPEFTTGIPPERSSVVADMINLWNNSFFHKRGVEVVLYKGREQRSGLLAGTMNDQLPVPKVHSDKKKRKMDKGRERQYSLYITHYKMVSRSSGPETWSTNFFY